MTVPNFKSEKIWEKPSEHAFHEVMIKKQAIQWLLTFLSDCVILCGGVCHFLWERIWRCDFGMTHRSLLCPSICQNPSNSTHTYCGVLGTAHTPDGTELQWTPAVSLYPFEQAWRFSRNPAIHPHVIKLPKAPNNTSHLLSFSQTSPHITLIFIYFIYIFIYLLMNHIIPHLAQPSQGVGSNRTHLLSVHNPDIFS